MNRGQKIKLLMNIQNRITPIKSLKTKYDYYYIDGSSGLYKCQQTNETLTYLEVKKPLNFAKLWR